MFSMPPATTTSFSPAVMLLEAKLTALRPLAHDLLTDEQGMLRGRPAVYAAWQAGDWRGGGGAGAGSSIQGGDQQAAAAGVLQVCTRHIAGSSRQQRAGM